MASLSNPQKLLILFFVAVISVGFGLGIGRIFRREAILQAPSKVASEIGKSLEPEPAEPEPTPEKALPKGWESHSGIIREAVEALEGTHQLVSKDGEILILLKARDQKLKVSQGMEAEVQGPVKPIEGSELKLMMVERVVFR